MQLFNLLGISQIRPGKLYGVTFGSQKNALELQHYGYSIVSNILKSNWEKIKRNTTLKMEFPVNIPFIPFGETQDSETPPDEMTLRSLAGTPAWGGRKKCIVFFFISGRRYCKVTVFIFGFKVHTHSLKRKS